MIGDLKERVTIQERITTQDTFGAESSNWNDIKTVWADVQGLRGFERYAAAQVQAQNDVKVFMRYRSDVKNKMRLVHGDRILDIESVVDIDRRLLEITCKEVAE